MENSGSVIGQFGRFLLYVGLQVFFLRNIALYEIGFCMLYVSIILLLPIEMSGVLVMVWGLFCGLAIDVIYDTMGIHAASCVFMAYMRTHVLRANRPSGGYESNMQPTIASMGRGWFLTYAATLVGLHHAAVFLLESGSWPVFVLSLSKILFSTCITVATLVIIQLTLYRDPHAGRYN